jgi:hypothetical protein
MVTSERTQLRNLVTGSEFETLNWKTKAIVQRDVKTFIRLERGMVMGWSILFN